MSKSNIYGVELDSIFGRIAKQLYQKSNIAIQGFQEIDYPDNSFRKYIAQRANLIGAIILPNNTFSKNAGTFVTSDIIFLQKKENVA